MSIFLLFSHISFSSDFHVGHLERRFVLYRGVLQALQHSVRGDAAEVGIRIFVDFDHGRPNAPSPRHHRLGGADDRRRVRTSSSFRRRPRADGRLGRGDLHRVGRLRLRFFCVGVFFHHLDHRSNVVFDAKDSRGLICFYDTFSRGDSRDARGE